jgi:hypothetical protein
MLLLKSMPKRRISSDHRRLMTELYKIAENVQQLDRKAINYLYYQNQQRLDTGQSHDDFP